MRIRRHIAQTGFTLVEIVMAITILAIVMGTAYSALNQILNVKTALDDKRDVTIMANSLIRRLTREFQLAVAERPLLFREDSSAPASGTAIYFKGEAESRGGGNSGDSLTFVAQEAGQYLPDGGTHSGLVQITYKVEKDPQKRDDSEQYVLVREEIPYLEPSTTNLNSFQKAKDKAFSQIMIFPVTENLTSFRLRYWDQEEQQWRDDWDQNQRQRIPALIQLVFSLKSPRGTGFSYATIVPVQAGIENG